MSKEQVNPDSEEDTIDEEATMECSCRFRIMKWMLLVLVAAGLFGLYMPATLSRDHLELHHKDWNGRQTGMEGEDAEGAIDELVVSIEGDKVAEGASSITAGSYDEAIREKKQLIERIDRSLKQFECLPIDPLFHYYKDSQMHFVTYDEVLVPSCDNVADLKWSGNRDNIAVWNRKRTVSEWAFHALLPNENILYYRPGGYNHVELIAISRLIGANGRIYVLGYEKGRKCFEQTQKANEGLSNVQFIIAEELPNVGYLNALIAHESIFKDGPISVYPVPAFTKMLLFCEDGKETGNTFRNFKVEKVLLKDKPCGTAVFTAGQGRGFFSFTRAGTSTERRVIAKFPNTHFIIGQYDKYKSELRQRIATELTTLEKYAALEICDPSTQTAKGVMTLYGHQLAGASLKEVQSWEEQRQPIEWVRQKQLQGDLYYEMRTFNLLVILELSLLLKTRKIIVICADYCGRIQGHERENMVLLPVSDSTIALKAAAIITDNSTLIRQSINEEFLQRGALLDFLAGENGLFLLRQLFVAHNLREVILAKQKGLCLGFTYLHSFWNSEEPNGFYDVSPSKLGYVAYAFYPGNPQSISARNKFLIQEMTSNQVQLKIISPSSFRFFEEKDSPIHPAFQLLSANHQSDYFRAYIMHNYGGIYSDIRHIHINLSEYFKKLYSSDSILVAGSAERGRFECRNSRIACWIVESLREKIMSTIQFAAKKNTQITREWLRLLNLDLDRLYEQLKRNPSQVNEQYRGAHLTRKDGTRFISMYPIEKHQFAEELFMQAQFKHPDRLQLSMPKPINDDYSTY